jgi:hypothetical protein
MTYTIESRYERSGWTPRERFSASDDLEALEVFEGEAEDPLSTLSGPSRALQLEGLRCGRVPRNTSRAAGENESPDPQSCGSTNLDDGLRDEAGPLVQCRDCGKIDSRLTRALEERDRR